MFAHRSSRPEVFCKKGVFKKFAKFTGKHLRQSLFSGKVAGQQLYYEKDSGTDAAKFLRTPIEYQKLKITINEVNEATTLSSVK